MTRRWLPHSLKARYLIPAVALAAVVLAVALLTQHLVARRSQAQREALLLHARTLQTTTRIREAMWAADHELINLLVNPRPGQEGQTRERLRRADALLNALLEDPQFLRSGAAPPARRLNVHLDTLARYFDELMRRRLDPNWTYPALPFITDILLNANIDFETASRLAINELEDSLDDDPAGRRLYRSLVEIRDLWRRIILNFRAILIRFAGLPSADPTPQEHNVEQLFEALDEEMERAAQALAAGGEAYFVTAESLPVMRTRSRDWHENFQKVKALRRSTRWRADVNYVQTHLRPALLATFRAIRELDEALLAWNQRTAEDMRLAASQGSLALWVAMGLVLAFGTGTYLLLQRSVLRPIRQLAETLQGVARGTGALSLPATDTLELQSLAGAFELMHEKVTQRQQALEHQALHDALTGLPNRVLLHDRLAHALQNAQRRGEQVGVLLLDLNRFKEVNDTLGHQAGDLLLQEVARRLQGLLREADTVARLGGDEFAVVLTGGTETGVTRLAGRVAEALEAPYRIGGHTLYANASIGVALYPAHGQDEETLLRHADVAMYAAKQSNRPVAVYEAERDHHSRDHLSLVADLRAAVDADALEVYYQPRLALADQSVAGIEALLRWRHPRRGWIPPDEVARLAENTGLITPLTERVIARALADWTALAHRPERLDLSINISPWTLHADDFPARLTALLERRPLTGGRLVLEITEGAVMYDPPAVRLTLQRLNALGAEIALDDFGTGFSSLSYLKLLPVTELKIDKTFVMDMLEDDNDAGIVRAVIDLGHHLGLRVTAEGVENPETLAQLRDLGCDLGQGFVWARPLPREELDRWLARHAPAGRRQAG